VSKPKLTVTSDFTDNFNDIVKSLKGEAVLVGIPEDNTERKESDGINNATLLAINNFGSPRHNIPPRPVMQLGIDAVKDEVGEIMGKAAKAALDGGSEKIDMYYNRAGSVASNSIKKVINSGEGFPGPSAATLAARKAAGFQGEKSLIVTGQMRNAITWVVKD
jgi:hypothetical protein